jgi:hypothetical protein
MLSGITVAEAAYHKLFNCIRWRLGDAVAFPFMMAVNEKREKVWISKYVTMTLFFLMIVVKHPATERDLQ